MTEGPDRKLIRLGKEAEMILDGEAFPLAVAMLEQEIIREWQAGDTVDVRERAHCKNDVLYDLVNQLERILGEGLLEEQKIDEDEE